MICAQCGCEITGKARREDGKIFCSLECSYIFSGLDTDEEEGYFEEEPVSGLVLDEEEY
jgi:hypothetical protein